MVELVMVPMYATASSPAAGLLKLENVPTPPKVEQDVRIEKPNSTAADEEGEAGHQHPADRLCSRRGKDVQELRVARQWRKAPISASRSDSKVEMGRISIGLSPELAAELGLLPATKYTPATR